MRFMWTKGHRPRCLQALANATIGAASAPVALTGTSGSGPGGTVGFDGSDPFLAFFRRVLVRRGSGRPEWLDAA